MDSPQVFVPCTIIILSISRSPEFDSRSVVDFIHRLKHRQPCQDFLPSSCFSFFLSQVNLWMSKQLEGERSSWFSRGVDKKSKQKKHTKTSSSRPSHGDDERKSTCRYLKLFPLCHNGCLFHCSAAPPLSLNSPPPFTSPHPPIPPPPAEPGRARLSSAPPVACGGFTSSALIRCSLHKLYCLIPPFAAPPKKQQKNKGKKRLKVVIIVAKY